MPINRAWLRQTRENKGLTQEALAASIGITRQHVGLLENGVATPSVEVAKKIASVLGFEWTRFYESEQAAGKEAV